MRKRFKVAWGGGTGETPSGEKSAQPLDTVSLWLQSNAGELLGVSVTMPALTGPGRVALLDVLVWSRRSSRAGLPCCSLRGTGQVPAQAELCRGRGVGMDSVSPGRERSWARGDAAGRNSPTQQRHGQGGTGSCCQRCWPGGCGHLPAVPVPQTPSPSNSCPGSFPSLSRAPALSPRGLGCALPLQQPEPREGEAPDFHQSLCPSSPGSSIVAFPCHPQVPVCPCCHQ